MTVWIVGLRLEGDSAWEFVGVFENEADADAACTVWEHFYGPAKMNVRLPDGAIDWPGCKYPRATA